MISAFRVSKAAESIYDPDPLNLETEAGPAMKRTRECCAPGDGHWRYGGWPPPRHHDAMAGRLVRLLAYMRTPRNAPLRSGRRP